MTPLGEQIHCSLEIFEQIEVNIVEIHMKFRMEYEEKKKLNVNSHLFLSPATACVWTGIPLGGVVPTFLIESEMIRLHTSN